MAKSATPAEMLKVYAYAVAYVTAFASRHSIRVGPAVCDMAAEDGLRRFLFDSRFRVDSAKRARQLHIRREIYQQLCATVFDMLTIKRIEASARIAKVLRNESIDEEGSGVGNITTLIDWKYALENLSREQLAADSVRAEYMKSAYEEIQHAA